MEEYRIIQPSPLLAPYIKNYWLLKATCDSPALVRTVPAGTMNLIFHRGNQLFSVQDNDLHPRLFLSGQEKTFSDLEYAGQINMIAVVFHPVGVRAFFNLPINKLNNLRVTAGDLGDKDMRELEHSLTGMEDDLLVILLIEQFLLKRLSSISEHNLKRIETTIRLINAGQSDLTLLADAACLSTKQFQRVFSEYVGSNPKEFSRTIRFQKALHILETQSQIPLTSLAFECGYFDQSHMIKEFKTFSGYTPSEYIAACPPHSDYFS